MLIYWFIVSFIQLINGVTDETLIVYIHRHETDRLASAIEHVVKQVCRNAHGIDSGRGPYFSVNLDTLTDRVHIIDDKENDGTKSCIVEEGALIEEMIQKRTREIGSGTQDSFSCETFDALENSRPNMILLNYHQADKLQNMIAKHHCPELLPKLPIHANVATSNKIANFVRLKVDETIDVPIKDWINEKKQLIEWAFGLYDNASCRGKFRDVEQKLFKCDDQSLELSRHY